MKRQIACLLLLLPTLLFSQKEFSHYSWNTLPAPQGGDTIKAVDGAVILMERRITEVYLNKENYFEEIAVFHRKVKVETHEAINAFNKIYINLSNVIDIIDIEARFIAANGKITNLPKSSIKQIDNLENEGNYKTFVIEGAENGGQIEFYYVLRNRFNPYGGYYLQDDTPKANVEVIFSYPSKLEYMFRCNNSFPSFVADFSNKEQTKQVAKIAYIPGIPKEKYARYKANMMGFDYTLSYNRYQSSLRVYSWAKASENIYNNHFDLTSGELSAAKEVIKQIDPSGGTQSEKIRKIENWVKNNITVKKNLENKKSLVENIKLKQCNFREISKLYIALFQSADIDFEYVKTGDINDQPFRTDFNAMNYLDMTLFYFPGIDQFLSPEDDSYRLGLTPSSVQGEYGLFMKPIAYNPTLKTLGYEVKYIPVQGGKTNSDTLNIQIKIDPANQLLTTNTQRIMHGDFGKSFQSILHLMDDKKRKELTETLFAMGKEHTDVIRSEYVNSTPDNIGYRPLVWNLELQSKALIEFAGKDLLVRIGETIGQQSELYQEKKRILPISVGILHDYYRKITFTVPTGYAVANLNDLNMRVEMKKEGKTSCIFTSNATLSGNIVTIVSTEYYLDEGYPASRYNEFRDVINAAADFNKKNLLLRKI